MLPVNTFLIWDDTREAVLIDAGCYTAREQQTLARFVEDYRLQLRHVVNTHLHFDHIFGNAFVYRHWGLRPQANVRDEFLLAQAETHCRMFGLELNEPTVSLGGYLEQGDILSFGHSHLEVLAVPGHSPGGLAFYCPEASRVFSGDSLFRGSYGRTDLPGGDYDSLMENIKARLLTLPEDTIVYPGHGNSTTIGREKSWLIHP